MTHPDRSDTLRLVWPQWQGAGRENVTSLLPEFPAPVARHGYVVGSRILDAIIPAHDGPTEHVVVEMSEPEEGSTGGIESRASILASLAAAQEAIARHDAERILTLGGECSVSVAPFAALAERHGEDLAVVWIDAHPDADTPETGYDGYHAMAASVLTGHGDAEVLDRLPATIDPSRFAYAGLHAGEPDALANVPAWGLTTIGPDQLRTSSDALLAWLASTGATKVAIHLDVDTVDSDEITFGLGEVPGGLTSAQVHRVIADVDSAYDVVGLTIAEYIPRQVMALQGMLRGLPLVDRRA
ncbi:arginase family protein [Brachybacterium kimchii]|uniref:Arginase family protein n=1 Tax=Brachybacterium kimchii TaxID=2942909 RepID=A0ABY4N3N1_9MICO|nr:arginase family protein [Brachybacterium kimchii]UQN29163.1 arginase family protein [Brachybacterium kimchii]